VILLLLLLLLLQCIVAAELVALAGPRGIKCGGAMLRDVGVYCLAIFSVLLAFFLGQASALVFGTKCAAGPCCKLVCVGGGRQYRNRGRRAQQDVCSVRRNAAHLI
jgi:hypothetical protein